MNINTYSMNLKESIAEFVPKQQCCRKMLLMGLLYCKTPGENAKIQSLINRLEDEFCDCFFDCDKDFTDIKNMFVCENCLHAFVRGLYLSIGTMSNPESAYQLELILPAAQTPSEIIDVLQLCGLPPKISVRRGYTVLYYKDSTAIEDFLGIIGAQKAAFNLMNTKIKKELRNTANRLTNCDSANIRKTVFASEEQIRVIRLLKSEGKFELLSEQLRETAQLRIDNPDLSLSALAELHSEKISKSGVNHRLSKIIEMFEKDQNIDDTHNGKSDKI